GEALASCNSPNRQGAIGAEVGIPAPLTHQKHRGWALEAADAQGLDGARLVCPTFRLIASFALRLGLHTPSVGALGSGIRASDQPQGRDGHLAGKLPLHLLIDDTLQLDGTQGPPNIKG